MIDESGTRIVELRPSRRSEFAALSSDMVGFWRTQTIAVAVRLGAIEALPVTEADLAARCCLRPDGAARLLRDHAPPRRQPPRTEEQLEPIDNIEGGALAAAAQHMDLVAKHSVLEHQLASGPNCVHGDGCDLGCLLAWRQLRPQPLHASQGPGTDARDARQAHPPPGARTA